MVSQDNFKSPISLIMPRQEDPNRRACLWPENDYVLATNEYTLPCKEEYHGSEYLLAE
jgi:hypothetical protein